jgi:hypothetical protein
MLSQPDPLLLEVFDALERELARALEVRDTLPEPTSAVRRTSGAIVLRRITGLRIILAELQVAIERRHSRLVTDRAREQQR